MNIVLRALVTAMLLSGAVLLAQNLPDNSAGTPPASASAQLPPQSPLSKPDRVYRIGRGVSVPKPIYNPAPVYADKARTVKAQGTAILKIIVTAEGTTRDIKIERGLRPDLDQRAIDAVSKWKFQPAMKKGQPVAVEIGVEVHFNLY